MRQIGIRTALTLSVLLLIGQRAEAQKYFFSGLGVTVPTGDFGNVAKTGWMLSAGLGKDVGSRGTWIELEGMFGVNQHDAAVGGRSTLFGAMAALGYTFSPQSRFTPYLRGALGLLSHKFTPETGPGDSEVKFAVSPGAGLSYVVGKKTQLYLEARYIVASGTGLFPIFGGVSINFGK